MIGENVEFEKKIVKGILIKVLILNRLHWRRGKTSHTVGHLTTALIKAKEAVKDGHEELGVILTEMITDSMRLFPIREILSTLMSTE